MTNHENNAKSVLRKWIFSWESSCYGAIARKETHRRKDQEIGGPQEHGFVKSTSDIILLGQLKHHFKKSLKIKWDSSADFSRNKMNLDWSTVLQHKEVRSFWLSSLFLYDKELVQFGLQVEVVKALTSFSCLLCRMDYLCIHGGSISCSSWAAQKLTA